MKRPTTFLTLLLLAAAGSPALAQEEQEQPPIPPAIIPNEPAGENIPEPDPNIPLGANAITTPIIEPKLSGNALAGLYRKFTGRRVIVSNAAAGAEFSFVQDASEQDPLTFENAAILLRKAATLESFIFVPDIEDPNLDILTLATAGVGPKGVGVGVYNDATILPAGDAVISYVMTLDYIKPDEAVRTFTQIIGQFGAYGSIAAVPNASAVVITENTSLIKRLIELKQEIDLPSTQVGTRFISVTYADVTELAATLNELLTSQQESQLTAGIQRAGDGAPVINPGNVQVNIEGGGGGGGGVETPVQIIPDARTNRIFAMGRPVDLTFVEGLVQDFDTQTDQRNFSRRKLKFLTVSEFLPVAGEALTRAFSGTGAAQGGQGGQMQGGGGNNRGNARGGQQGGGRGGVSTNQFGGGGNTNQFGGGGAGGGGTGSVGSGSTLSPANISTAPQSILIGRTLLVADNITNSLVVQGPPSGVEIIENLLDQLDVKPEQVLISTVFGQLNLTNQTEFGVDFLRTVQGDQNRGAGQNRTGGAIVDIPDLQNPTDFPGGTLNRGLSVYGMIGDHFNLYIRALQETGNFTVLSRPSVYTANNQVGLIRSGQRIAVPTNSFNSGTTGQSTNIDYRDVVLSLEVVPLVNSEDTVTLTISFLNDEIVGMQNVEGVGDVPTIGTRELQTRVTVPNNRTVVLGGLITSTDRDSVTGIPILSSIPGIGKLFSTTTKQADRSELIIFIQPSIVYDDVSEQEVQDDFDARYELAQDVRGFTAPAATIEGQSSLLPTADLNRDAAPARAPRAVPVNEDGSAYRPPERFAAPGQSNLRPVNRR